MSNPKNSTIESSSYIRNWPTITSESVISGTRVSINSLSYIDEKGDSILCDGSIQDEIVDEFGSTVYVGVITQSVDENDPFREITENIVWHRTKALVLEYSAEDDREEDGIIRTGGTTFSFKNSDESLISVNNKIKYAGDTYDINKIIKHPAVDTLYYLEVIAE